MTSYRLLSYEKKGQSCPGILVAEVEGLGVLENMVTERNC